MPRVGSVTSPRPPGAGRTVDWRWPSGIASVPVGNSPGGSSFSRINATTGAGFTQASTGSGSSSAYQVRSGRVAVARLASAVGTVNGTGQSWRLASGNGFVPPYLARSAANPTEYATLRMWLTAAFSAIPSVDCDYGIEFMFSASGAAQNIILNAIPGFGFVRRAGAGRVAIVRNDVNGLRYVDLPTVTPTDLNAYEARITSATAANDATLSLLVNGVEVLSESWGLGVLPTYQATFPTMLVSIVNFCGAGGNLDVYEFRCVQAPTILETF